MVRARSTPCRSWKQFPGDLHALRGTRLSTAARAALDKASDAVREVQGERFQWTCPFCPRVVDSDSRPRV
eukprot:1728904-Alexandrium_andersonii.AAC.1